MKIKTRRKLCLIIGIACFLVAYGLIGGLERDYITLRESITGILICFIVGGFSLYKSGYLK